MWRTSLAGIAFWCLVVGSRVLEPPSCWFKSKGVWPEDSRVRLLWRRIQKDVDTSNIVNLKVPLRSFCFLVVTNWFCCTEAENDNTRILLCYCGTPPHEFVCNSWMFEKYAPPIPVSRLLGRSGFGDSVGSVEAAAGNDIQEITFLGGFLMWNYAAVCGGRIWLEIFVSICSGLWKSCER